MPYRYIAYNASNAVVQGVIGSATEGAAEEALVKAGYRPIVLRPASRKLDLSRLFPSLFGVKQKDVIAMTQQLAVLLKSAIPLVSALEILKSQFSSPAFQTTLDAIIQDVRGGTPLSSAFRQFPRVFPSLYVRMVAVGERSGNLEGMLQEIADFYKRETDLKKRVQHAMFYPTIVVFMTIVVGTIMVVFVLPQVATLARTLNVPLPLFTRALIGLGGALGAYKLLLLLGILASVAGLTLTLRQPKGRAGFHALLLHLPLVKRIIVYRELSRMSRTMGMLLDSGLPLPEILEMVNHLAGNEMVKRTVQEMRLEVMNGRSMSGPLGNARFIPSMFTQMVRTGEVSGTMTTALATMAQVYESDLNDALATAVSLIEPIMTIGIGLMVGAMAVSVILPIYSIVGNSG